MSDPMLEVRDLRKTYGDRVVLADVDLTVEPHDVVCLIGASGSGKSTLLRCLNLLEPIDDGVIVLDMEDHDPARGFGSHRAERFHHLDETDGVARCNHVTNLLEHRLIGRSPAIEGAWQWRKNGVNRHGAPRSTRRALVQRMDALPSFL